MGVKLGSFRKAFQWITGILFAFFLMCALFTSGLTRVSAPKVAKPVLASTLKAMVLQTDMANNYRQTKSQLRSRPSAEPVQVPGLPKVRLTAGEAVKLDVDSFAGRISDELAERIYEGDIASMTLEEQKALGAVLKINRETHRSLVSSATNLWMVADILGLIMFLLGRRFGRLFSLGLTIMIASVVPLCIYIGSISKLNTPPANPQQAVPGSVWLMPALQAAETNLMKYVTLACMFMFAAAAGRLAYSLTTRRQMAGETAAAGNLESAGEEEKRPRI